MVATFGLFSDLFYMIHVLSIAMKETNKEGDY